MDISVSIEKGRVDVTVVHVHGNIDSSTYGEFEKHVDGLIDGGALYVLIDLSHAGFVSSAGLRAFNGLFNRLRALAPDGTDEEVKKGIRDGSYHSGHLKLLNPSKDVRQVLELSGFDMYLEIHKDLKEAVASF